MINGNLDARDGTTRASDSGSLNAIYVGRRAFVNTAVVGWAAFWVALAAIGGIFGRFFFPNVPVAKALKVEGKRPEEYPVNNVDASQKSDGFWIVRTETTLYALSTVCTHLGCTPNWLAAEEKFKCPCHGSGYRKTGINFEGPAPRPLERFWIGYADSGRILVDKGKKFQYELGQWEMNHSFLEFQA